MYIRRLIIVFFSELKIMPFSIDKLFMVSWTMNYLELLGWNHDTAVFIVI